MSYHIILYYIKTFLYNIKYIYYIIRVLCILLYIIVSYICVHTVLL